MCAERRRPRLRGQALVEVLVALLAIVPLYFGVVWLAKVLDARQATIAAARMVAFECTVRADACIAAAARPELAREVRRRVFARHDVALRSDDVAAGQVAAGQGRAFWTDRGGRALLERFEDVEVDVAPLRFDSPRASAAGEGDRMIPGALRLLSELGGPGRFGLDLAGGLLDARVRARLSRTAPDDGFVVRLAAMPVTLDERLAILTDAWTASAPYGPAADSVEARVGAGARVPLVDTAIAAGWLPVRGLLAVGATLGFESRANSLRWHRIDVDLVPSDRIGVMPGGFVPLDSVPLDPLPTDRP
jgi:hypothetical protein